MLLAAFAVIGMLATIDLVSDVNEGTQVLHVTAESAVIVVALTGAFLLIDRLVRRARRAREDVDTLTVRLEESRREAFQWREEAQALLQGLGIAMDHQFGEWKLTSAEKEVALLLLKGLSHKEIAAVRGISEPTARQQARSVYRKAGVTGRRDLAAFFLEDLTLPRIP